MEIKRFLDQISATVPMFEVLVKYIIVEFDELDAAWNFFPRICDTLPGHSPAQETATSSELPSSPIATCTLSI